MPSGNNATWPARSSSLEATHGPGGLGATGYCVGRGAPLGGGLVLVFVSA
jgi:hypothetical protein